MDQTVGLTGAQTAPATTAPVAKPTTTTAAPATTAAPTPKPARGATTGDKQLVACIRIAKLLDALTASEREFALNYIDGKYNGTA